MKLPPTKFIALCICLVVVACTRQPDHPPLEENTSQHRNPINKPFYHGVASGDPYSTSVLIWTRVTPESQRPEIEGEWEISTSTSFIDPIQTGQFKTDSSRDYTVKIVVEDLSPATVYFYRFKSLDAYSSVGRTKTLSDIGSLDPVKFAVASCSNYEFGYFNSYAAMAEEPGLDVVIHLGDYIYEYGPGRYGDSTTGRFNIPPHEIITLQDYRDRYALYRLDEDLQAAHANHPFITIWDDHEVANNSFKDGAQNHQADEGDYLTRKRVATQAYYEWLPIRDDANHYRSFSFGDLADLIMLDERLVGRTAPADSVEDPSLLDENRTILGDEQMTWFIDNLQNSTATWKIVGNQVIYSHLNWGFSTFNINLDSWDGYPVDQNKVAQAINGKVSNVVFITGDTHSSWAFEVSVDPYNAYNKDTGEGSFAVEFGTPSINSANSNERTSDEEVLVHEERITNSDLNPHLKYSNLRDHGYLVLTLDENEIRAEYKYVGTLHQRSNRTETGKILKVLNGSTRLLEMEE